MSAVKKSAASSRATPPRAGESRGLAAGDRNIHSASPRPDGASLDSSTPLADARSARNDGSRKRRKLVEEKSRDKKPQTVDTTTKRPLSPAASMEELMARKQSKFFVPRRGQILKGVVTEATSRLVLLDIGAKTEGLVIDKEFDEVRDFAKTLAVGDEINAYVLSPENDRGQILLSLRTAASDWMWQKIQQWQKVGDIIEVRGLDVNRGGLVARIDSLDLYGFIPASQLSPALSAKMDDLINRLIKVKIIEVDRQNNRLIFSERHVSQADEIAAQKLALEKVKPGDKFKGTVAGVTDFGAFVKVKIDKHDIEGLIHISELSWDKVPTAGDIVKQGQEVEVSVVDVNPENGKVGFSLKRLAGDPWQGIEDRYPPGQKLTGTIAKIASFGAIVQLEPGVSGLLHISKIPAAKEPAVGDKLEVVVEDLDRSRRRLSLGMAAEEIPAIYR